MQSTKYWGDLMKLREIVLKNFRGYYRETRIPVDDLTALIGKNDVGKSTILEALDIFFNQIKIDIGDRNVLHIDEETGTEAGEGYCCFFNHYI